MKWMKKILEFWASWSHTMGVYRTKTKRIQCWAKICLPRPWPRISFVHKQNKRREITSDYKSYQKLQNLPENTLFSRHFFTLLQLDWQGVFGAGSPTKDRDTVVCSPWECLPPRAEGTEVAVRQRPRRTRADRELASWKTKLQHVEKFLDMSVN